PAVVRGTGRCVFHHGGRAAPAHFLRIAGPGNNRLPAGLPKAELMNATLPLLSASDWLSFFLYYLSLSLMTIGGALVTAPDMHRYLVQQNAWITDTQFTASIAMAQAAPGPNIL